MKVATNIKTADWNRMIDILVRDGWKIKSKYRGIDEGVDYDYLVLYKKSDSIFLGWTNYFEGEIKCPEPLFDYLAKQSGTQFSYGDPIALAPGFFEKEEPKSIQQWFKEVFRRK